MATILARLSRDPLTLPVLIIDLGKALILMLNLTAAPRVDDLRQVVGN